MEQTNYPTTVHRMYNSFENHFNCTDNTRLKTMISVDNHLGQGKSILSDRRAMNWELHDGAEDVYEDADMDLSSDSEANIPLARISSENRKIPIPTAQRRQSSQMKLTTRGILFRKFKNRKYGDPYFNPVNEPIVDSSDHTVTLENGHSLRTSHLAIKVKLFPGPPKILVNPPPRGTYSVTNTSLPGKRKIPPPKKTTRANSQKRMAFANRTPTPGTTQAPSEVIII